MGRWAPRRALLFDGVLKRLCRGCKSKTQGRHFVPLPPLPPIFLRAENEPSFISVEAQTVAKLLLAFALSRTTTRNNK